MQDAVTGGNEEDLHVRNVNLGRDFRVDLFGDLRVITPDDACPRCGSEIRFGRGIEVGHIFILGTKYSSAMKAVYLDQQGKENPMVMGCYGIGVGRTAAAAIEQNHDDKGIVWPRNLAPFQVIIIPVNYSNEDLKTVCDTIYDQLQEAGIEPLLDDRTDRLGGKLKDADLLGIPLQIIVGPKNLSAGQVEIKVRKTNESNLHPYPDVIADIPNILKGL